MPLKIAFYPKIPNKIIKIIANNILIKVLNQIH